MVGVIQYAFMLAGVPDDIAFRCGRGGSQPCSSFLRNWDAPYQTIRGTNGRPTAKRLVFSCRCKRGTAQNQFKYVTICPPLWHEVPDYRTKLSPHSSTCPHKQSRDRESSTRFHYKLERLWSPRGRLLPQKEKSLSRMYLLALLPLRSSILLHIEI